MWLWLCTVMNAQSASSVWAGYSKSVISTAAVMPITYVLADVFKSSSNQLIPGLLPPVLTGVLLPASMASASSLYFGGVHNLDTKGRFGTVATLNLGLYSGGTAMGLSTQNLQEAVLYGAISAILLPIPSWVGAKSSNASVSVWMTPEEQQTLGRMNLNVQLRF